MHKETLLAQLISSPDDVSILQSLAAIEMKEELYDSSLERLHRALSLSPEHIGSLNTRAQLLLKIDKVEEALGDLYTLYRLQPTNIEVRNQIRLLHRKLVDGWHYGMMNDTERNIGYLKAIEKVVKPGMTVFEIGTGSGLLSMMAARAGAKHVYTCERNLPIRNIATEIIRKNGYADKITVLNSWSTSVQVGREIPEKVDIILGEIFGPALLDEQAIQYFDDARHRLLKPTGAMLPMRATMYGMLVESENITRNSIVKDVCGFDLSLFNTLHDDPTFQLMLIDYSYKELCEPFEIRTIDFREQQEHPLESPLQIAVKSNGIANLVVQWFRLELAPGIFIDTSPFCEPTHWEQHIQVFENPVAVKAGTNLNCILRQFPDRFSLTPA